MADVTWDGLDAFARPVHGRQKARVSLGYVYDGVYMAPADKANAFAALPAGTPLSITARNEIVLSKIWWGVLDAWDARASERIGGFSLDVHHAFDPVGKVLYLGNGKRRSDASIEPVMSTVAGTSAFGKDVDGLPATQSKLWNPYDVAVGPDGRVLIADYGNQRVAAVTPQGTLITLAGNGSIGFSGDGGPGVSAKLNGPRGVAVGPDGSVYIGDSFNKRVRRVDPNGIITTVAGNGQLPSGNQRGDGGLAVNAQLVSPEGVAVAADGSLYIADPGDYRIRRVGTDGIIRTVAGTGGQWGSDDGQPAINVATPSTRHVGVWPSGGFVFAESSRVRVVGQDGLVRTIAGQWNVFGSSGDGGPGTMAKLQTPWGLGVGPDGTVVFTDVGTDTIRRVTPDGIITTIGGNGAQTYNGDGKPALSSATNNANGVAIGPDGAVYVADTFNHRVRKIASGLPALGTASIVIPSEDGSDVYLFNADGQHLSTKDGRTGAVKLAFAYDAKGLLTSVTDVDGQVTTLVRDAVGDVTSVVAPHGQTTTLSMGADGYLTSITSPANEAVSFTYGSGGLMTSMLDARGGLHVFAYDVEGRLTVDQDPAGGSKTLVKGVGNVTISTALGRSTTYGMSDVAAGGESRSVLLPNGQTGTEQRLLDGTRTLALPHGTTVTLSRGPDPRFGMLAPFLTSQVEKTPGNKTRTVTRSRVTSPVNLADPWGFATLTETVNVNGQPWMSVFDKATGALTTTSPLGRAVSQTYDVDGKVVAEQTSGLLPVSYGYDAEGKLVSVTAGSRVWLRGYDPQTGWLASTTDPLLEVTAFGRDAAGRVTVTVRPDNAVIAMSYDLNSNTDSVTPPGRPAHAMSYTPLDRLASYTPPLVNNEPPAIWAYDLDGQLASHTRPDGQMIGYTRDGAGRVSSVDLPAGQGSATIAYDAKGRVGSVAGPMGVTLAYAYDGSLLTGKTWSGAVVGALTRVYDNDFRVMSDNVNGVSQVTYTYDNDGLLISAGPLALTRDPQHGLVIGLSSGALAGSRGYNGHGEVIGVSFQSGANPLYTASLVRDNLGRITQKAEAVQGVTHTYDYAYDAGGRLTDVMVDGLLSEHYDLDPNGNRLSGTYDAQDRLLADGARVYTYTDAGELASKTDTATNATTLTTYDALGALRQVVLPSGVVIDYVIDGEGHRVWKKKNGVKVAGFLYSDKLRPVAELGPAGALVSRFIYATGRNVPDVMQKGGKTYLLITDTIGSVRLVVDAANGAVAQRLDYDTFGNVLADTNPGFQPFGFAGGLYDPDTKLVRFGARDYDPEMGRWTAKDPLLFGGGDTNLYGYVLGDPVNLVDPEGTDVMTLAWWELALGGAGTATAGGLTLASGGIFGLCILLALTLESDAAKEDDNEKYCMDKFVECLENPWQPPNSVYQGRKDCRGCYKQCQWHRKWPELQCP